MSLSLFATKLHEGFLRVPGAYILATVEMCSLLGAETFIGWGVVSAYVSTAS